MGSSALRGGGAEGPASVESSAGRGATVLEEVTPISGLRDIATVILAGGLGSRLRSVVGEQPKVLAQVAGRPFLAYVLDHLAEAGVRSVVLCTGYKADAVADQFGASYRGVALTYSRETAPLGTGGAVRRARSLVASDPILVVNGDSYCAADLGAFLALHRDRRAAASLLLTEVADTARYGRVEVDAAGAVLGFTEKAPSGGLGWINAGVYLLGQAFLRALPPAESFSLEREVFPAWVGHGLTAYRSSGAFIDIGTPESYARAGHLFAAGAMR
jgi:NDP-sugar pyrophosphorylase family protein